MSDPGRVIVAVSFFGTLVVIVRMLVHAPWPQFSGSRTSHDVVVDNERMTRLEQAVESIALEVERISEGQRFTTRLLADRVQAEPLRSVSPAEPIRHTTPH